MVSRLKGVVLTERTGFEMEAESESKRNGNTGHEKSKKKRPNQIDTDTVHDENQWGNKSQSYLQINMDPLVNITPITPEIGHMNGRLASPWSAAPRRAW